MPYIKSISRQFLDDPIKQCVEELREYAMFDERVGVCNYVVTRIVAGAMLPDSKHRNYHAISRALSVLHDAETEMRRRLMDVREDKAISMNGDIPEYEQT
jgi:hypothetical protein